MTGWVHSRQTVSAVYLAFVVRRRKEPAAGLEFKIFGCNGD